MKNETYGKEQFYTVQVTNQGISIYDRKNELVHAYVNPNIQSVLYMDDAYLYCLADAVTEPIYKHGNIEGEDVDLVKESTEAAGLFVYDLARMINHGSMELYKLSSALVGINNQISYSEFN